MQQPSRRNLLGLAALAPLAGGLLPGAARAIRTVAAPSFTSVMSSLPAGASLASQGGAREDRRFVP